MHPIIHKKTQGYTISTCQQCSYPPQVTKGLKDHKNRLVFPPKVYPACKIDENIYYDSFKPYTYKNVSDTILLS